MHCFICTQKASLKRLAFFVLFLAAASAGAKKSSFASQHKIQQSLLPLMDVSVSLHKAVYDQNKEQMDLAVSKMLKQITLIRQNISGYLPYHEHSYMDKLLSSLEFNIQAFKNTGRYKKNYMRAINRKLAHLARVYNVTKYAVFFCPSDRSIWMQKDPSKPLYLGSRSRRCGVLVGARQ